MAIQLSDLTNGSTVRASGTQPVWEGTAIFDVLMKAVNENINIQYELTRITGSDYATVYLGAIETCIREATNLLLQKAIADKEIEAKQAQILNIQEDTRLKTAQANAFPLQAVQELALTTEQVLTQKEEVKLKQEGIKLAIEETKLKSAQAVAFPLQSTKDLELKQVQINATIEDTKLRSAQVLTQQEETKLKAEQATAYPLQSSKDLDVKTKEIEVKTQQILTMQNDDNIKSAQSTKDLDVKTKDLDVKIAQKNKLVDDILTASKQRDLYTRQITGFDDNKYQKLFESQLSSWGLMFSSGMLTEKPSIITGDKVSQLYTKLTTGV